jgi:acylphosphatase
LRHQFTQNEAQLLKVRGWIRNTENRTVQGQLEGEEDSVLKMYGYELAITTLR